MKLHWHESQKHHRIYEFSTYDSDLWTSYPYPSYLELSIIPSEMIIIIWNDHRYKNDHSGRSFSDDRFGWWSFCNDHRKRITIIILVDRFEGRMIILDDHSGWWSFVPDDHSGSTEINEIAHDILFRIDWNHRLKFPDDPNDIALIDKLGFPFDQA